ncbi:MAG: DNA polymerase III subunit beta [Hyphomicrobiales bacterium]
MKLTINKKALSAAMADVDRVVENRNTIPILGNVLLQAAETLTITGTNLDAEMCVQVPANVEMSGSTTVPSGLLAKLARSMPADSHGDLALELSENGHELQIIAARSHYNLPTLPCEDFPSMQGPDDKPVTMALPGSTLAGLLQRVAHSMCNEETRFYLCGVYLHVDDDSEQPHLTAVATDGKQLAKNRILAPQGATAEMPGIIIHERTVRYIIHWLENHPDDVSFRVDQKKIAIEAGPNRLTSKLVDGTFPDYERVIPKDNSICLEIDAAAIADAIGRTKALDTGKESGALVMELGADTLCFSARSLDDASAREEFTVDFDGDDFRMGFTINLADTVFSAVPGKTAKLHLDSAGSPALLIPDDEPEVTLVLMGRRV